VSDAASPGPSTSEREPAADDTIVRVRVPAGSRPGGRGAAARWGWRLGALGLAGVAGLGPLWIQAGVEGRAELEHADEAVARGDADGELEHLGRALRWRAPLWGHDERALERLWDRGEQAQALGDDGRSRALAAYREVRRGLLATRAWGVPHRARWDEANVRIAALMAEQERAAGTDASGRGDPEGFHRELLERVPGPEPIRGNLAALSFVGWLVALGGFVLRGIDPRGRVQPRAALRWGGAALGLLVAWAVLLATAHAG